MQEVLNLFYHNATLSPNDCSKLEISNACHKQRTTEHAFFLNKKKDNIFLGEANYPLLGLRHVALLLRVLSI